MNSSPSPLVCFPLSSEKNTDWWCFLYRVRYVVQNPYSHIMNSMCVCVGFAVCNNLCWWYIVYFRRFSFFKYVFVGMRHTLRINHHCFVAKIVTLFPVFHICSIFGDIYVFFYACLTIWTTIYNYYYLVWIYRNLYCDLCFYSLSKLKNFVDHTSSRFENWRRILPIESLDLTLSVMPF